MNQNNPGDFPEYIATSGSFRSRLFPVRPSRTSPGGPTDEQTGSTSEHPATYNTCSTFKRHSDDDGRSEPVGYQTPVQYLTDQWPRQHGASVSGVTQNSKGQVTMRAEREEERINPGS